MPRIARKNSLTTFFHIMVQGIDREYIFYKEEYIKEYQKLIIENSEPNDVKLLAYCIMNNHAHMLIKTEKTENMSKYMQKINTKYAKYYNKSEKRVGYVFRDRYLAESIENQKQLWQCVAYIHRNPVEAGMVKNLDEYKYSTYNNYINKSGIIDNQTLKIVFGTDTEYLYSFNTVHKNIYEFRDIEDKKDYHKIIEKYKKAYTLRIVREDRELATKLIFELIYDAGISISKASKLIKIDRFKIAKIINDKKEKQEKNT